MADATQAISQVYADVLTNRTPPYGIKGGLFDCLTETGGGISAVSNDEARHAQRLFEECEGIDLDPAAGVTVASLISAAKGGQIDPGKDVVLNITGGGYLKVQEEYDLIPVPSAITVGDTTAMDQVTMLVNDWVKDYA